MPGAKKQRDPIPESFASIEEAAEFWDTHSVADYWDETHEVHFDIHVPRRRSSVRLERDLADRLKTLARQQGLSLEDLVNRWLKEKLQETAPAA
jgi:predicted DNA-binding ribbon-helix-helix protein